MDTLLTLENVGLTYHTKKNETVAIKNLSFSVKREQFVAIIGPSGCGKTTILSMICGLFPVSEGRILMENNIVEVGDKTGYMLQKDELFEWLRTIALIYLKSTGLKSFVTITLVSFPAVCGNARHLLERLLQSPIFYS